MANRPDSGKISEAATEVDVETVDDVNGMTREQLEAELIRVKTEYNEMHSLLSRLFNDADSEAFEILRVKFNSDQDAGNMKHDSSKLKGLLSKQSKDANVPSRAVTFSPVKTQISDRSGDNLKLHREATFVNLDTSNSYSRNMETENALSNRLCQLDSYLGMRGITEGSSSSASVTDHRMMRMVSISDSSQGSRPASSAVGSNTSRPRSASQPRSSFQSVKNEVYKPEKFTQPVPKRSFHEINSFLNGNKVLPSPGAPDEFNFKPASDVCYEDITADKNSRKRAAANAKENPKTSLVPPRRDLLRMEEDKEGNKKTPLTTHQKGPLKWTSETGSMSAYDAGFLDDKSEALPGGYPRKITLNNQCTTVHKKQGSLKKGFTTNQKTDVILSRTKSAGERVSRPRSAVACYTDFVYSVPTPVIMPASNNGAETGGGRDSKTFLRPPLKSAMDSRSSSDLTEMRQQVLRPSARENTPTSNFGSASTNRSKTATGIISEGQIEMKIAKHMDSLSHQYKNSTLALQKKIGVTIDGLVK
ncbi:uncharacterized protein LOC134842271 isoform X2 [Symsagittifera roscoffensis]|uniref:uncharacterized protein LOC134842271 isoform X2 n=1 Tax=Symsagittifera roscoffensis TaxID=84072 RepID=UPI00307CAA27